MKFAIADHERGLFWLGFVWGAFVAIAGGTIAIAIWRMI